jgi:hypothetical protein
MAWSFPRRVGGEKSSRKCILLLTDLGGGPREIEVGDLACAQAKQAPGGRGFSGSEGFVGLEDEMGAGWGSCEAIFDG